AGLLESLEPRVGRPVAVRPEAGAGALLAERDLLRHPLERAAPDEQDVRRVDLDDLRPEPRGAIAADAHLDLLALEDLEQPLLHALAGHVAVVPDPLGELVELVDVDDA